MFIDKTRIGDITSFTNKSHIVFAMNDTLEEATPLIAPYVEKLAFGPENPLTLGSVLSFPFTNGRKLFLVICHKIGFGGWEGADQYLRFGLDWINHYKQKGDTFSIVEVGTGPSGMRDGADAASLKTAIATSYLPVYLFVREEVKVMAAAAAANKAPLNLAAFAYFSPQNGYKPQVPFPVTYN